MRLNFSKFLCTLKYFFRFFSALRLGIIQKQFLKALKCFVHFEHNAGRRFMPFPAYFVKELTFFALLILHLFFNLKLWETRFFVGLLDWKIRFLDGKLDTRRVFP